MSLSHKIERGDLLSASVVEQNFKSIQTNINQVSSIQVEDGSLDTRHLSKVDGAWKKITKLTNGAVFLASGSLRLLCPTTTGSVIVHPGALILVIAKAQFGGNDPSSDSDCEITLEIDTITPGTVAPVRSVYMKVVDTDHFGFSTFYMFKSDSGRSKYKIELWLQPGDDAFVGPTELHIYSMGA